MERKKNIWILGGTGFIGNALVRYLSAKPENRLHLLLNKNTPYRELEGYNTFSGGLSEIDLQWLEMYPPDIIFHLARPAGKNHITRKIASLTGNQLNRRLIRIISALSSSPVIVYVSGSLMYGRRQVCDPASESSKLAPDSFARFYHQTEKPWIEEQKRGELDVRFARPGWILGPGSWFRKFFWEPHLGSGKVPCYGDGNQMMSIIHMDDCAVMVDILGSKGVRGQNLNIFSGKPIPQYEFSRLMAEIVGAEIEFIHINTLRRKFGSTTADALCSSSSMTTEYSFIHQKADIVFKNKESMLTDVIRLLKNKQGILPETP